MLNLSITRTKNYCRECSQRPRPSHVAHQEQRDQRATDTAVASAASPAAVPAKPTAGVDHGPVAARSKHEAEHGIPARGAAQLCVVRDIARGAGRVTICVWRCDEWARRGGDADTETAAGVARRARLVGFVWVDGAERGRQASKSGRCRWRRRDLTIGCDGTRSRWDCRGPSERSGKRCWRGRACRATTARHRNGGARRSTRRGSRS